MKNKDKKYIKLFLWVAFLFSFWVFNVLAVVDTPIKVNPEDGTNFVNETTYTLLAPFGDSLKTIDTTNIADYFNLMIKIFIGLCAVLAVVMIVVYGIQYMGTDSIFSKSKAKERIGEAILGLLIALGSYAILNTINPDLTEIRLNIGKLEFKDIGFVDSKTYQSITGQRILRPSEYEDMGRKIAKEVGIPYCAMAVILERESRGNPGAIGFDENVPNEGIPSRVSFINSGKKYSGETFISSSSLITDKKFINQTIRDVTNEPGLGLDWRFSKGIGLTQVTFFPEGYFSAGYKTNPIPWSKRNVLPPKRQGYTPKELLDPENNLRAGAQIWKEGWDQCNRNIYQSWLHYNTGSCNSSNTFAVKEATARTEFYNGCSEEDKLVK